MKPPLAPIAPRKSMKKPDQILPLFKRRMHPENSRITGNRKADGKA